MLGISAPVVLAFGRSSCNSSNGKIAVCSQTSFDGSILVIGFSDGSLHLYENVTDPRTTTTNPTDNNNNNNNNIQWKKTVDIIGSSTYGGPLAIEIVETKWGGAVGSRRLNMYVMFNNGSLRMYDLPQGALKHEMDLPFQGNQIARFGKNDYLLVWGQSTDILLLELSTLKILDRQTVSHGWPVIASFYPQHDTILVSNKEGLISKWKLTTPKGGKGHHGYLENVSSVNDTQRLDTTNLGTINKIRQISNDSWAVGQSKGWSIVKLDENQQLSRHVSTDFPGITNIIPSYISTNDDMPDKSLFLVVSEKNEVFCVFDDNIHIIDNIWPQGTRILLAAYIPSLKTLQAITARGDIISVSSIQVSNEMEFKKQLCWSEPVPIEYLHYDNPRVLSTTAFTNRIVTTSNEKIYLKGLLELFSLNDDDDTPSKTLSCTITCVQGLQIYTRYDNQGKQRAKSVPVLKSIPSKSGEDKIYDDLLIGTVNGTLVFYESEQEIPLFSSPVTKIMKVPVEFGVGYEGAVFLLSSLNNIAIVDVFEKSLIALLPGYHFPIVSLSTYFNSTNLLGINYKNGFTRYWDLEHLVSTDRPLAECIPITYYIPELIAMTSSHALDESAADNDNGTNFLIDPNMGELGSPVVIMRLDRIMTEYKHAHLTKSPNLPYITQIIRSLLMFIVKRMSSKGQQLSPWDKLLNIPLDGDHNDNYDPNVRLNDIIIGNASYVPIQSAKQFPYSVTLSYDRATHTGHFGAWEITIMVILSSLLSSRHSRDKVIDDGIRWWLQMRGNKCSGFEQFTKNMDLLEGLANLWLNSPELVRVHARICLDKVVSIIIEPDQMSELEYWEKYLLNAAKFINEDDKIIALLVLSSMFSKKDNAASFSNISVCKDICSVLESFLSSHNPAYKIAAFDLVGRIWTNLSPYIDTSMVINLILQTLYDNGFTLETAVPVTSFSDDSAYNSVFGGGRRLLRRESITKIDVPSLLLQSCFRAVISIARSDKSTLLTCLEQEVKSDDYIFKLPNHSANTSSLLSTIELRVCAVALLCKLISYIDPGHFSFILPTVVRALDHNDPKYNHQQPKSSGLLLDELSTSGNKASGTRLSMTSVITNFLALSLNSFKGILAFNKTQQILALAPPLSSKSIQHAALVLFDLKTGQQSATLLFPENYHKVTFSSSEREESKKTIYSTIYGVKFSPDGKLIAAFDRFTGCLFVWRTAPHTNFFSFGSSSKNANQNHDHVDHLGSHNESTGLMPSFLQSSVAIHPSTSTSTISSATERSSNLFNKFNVPSWGPFFSTCIHSKNMVPCPMLSSSTSSSGDPHHPHPDEKEVKDSSLILIEWSANANNLTCRLPGQEPINVSLK